jgi:hypothetical protein
MVETSPNAGDALDPALSFDAQGRPYVVWESHPDSGGSEIVFSMFLASRWMVPFRVDSDDEMGSNPAITVLEDGTVRVTYQTAQGPMTRNLRITRPWTITDDITPFGTLTVTDPRR